MFFSVNTFLWSDSFSERHLPLLEQFKEWGADGVEFACARLDQFPVDAVRRELDRLGLGCTLCTSPPSAELSCISTDPRDRRAAVDLLKKAVALAKGMGATVLAGPLYAHVAWFTGTRPTDQQFQWAVEGFSAIGPDLEANEIELAIEPMNRFETFFMSTAEQGVRLCEAINHRRIGLMLDTAHMVIEERDPLAAIRTAGPWLKHLQTPEHDRGTPGTGRLIDWPGLFRTLDEIGYGGGCAIESFPFKDPELAGKTWAWRDFAASPESLARDGLTFLKRVHAEATT